MQVSGKTWARIAAVGLIALAVLVLALNLRRGRLAQAPLSPPSPTVAVSTDPLVGELFRCQALGQAGASDPDCLRTWAENRRRFLTPSPRADGGRP
jgi:conjugative transfer region protein TrbK